MDILPQNGRDLAALRHHYEVERELADRLRRAPAGERKGLYQTVYNELFLRVPDHPQNTRKVDAERQGAKTEEQLWLLKPFLRSDAVFLEVGAGDCHLTMRVAAQVRYAYGVDVSDVIAAASSPPDNFSLILSDGVNIPVPSDSIDVAYSNSLLEHLHPDDAAQQLKEIYRGLAPGGVYICRTPHRFSGPQDISQFFDDEATGFHLKEYTYEELRKLFRRIGFTTTSTRFRLKGRSFRVAEPIVLGMERILGLLPRGWRRGVALWRPLRSLFDCVTIIGRKAG